MQNSQVPEPIRQILNSFALQFSGDPAMFAVAADALHDAVVEMGKHPSKALALYYEPCGHGCYSHCCLCLSPCACCGSTDGQYATHMPVATRPEVKSRIECAPCWSVFEYDEPEVTLEDLCNDYLEALGEREAEEVAELTCFGAAA